MPRRLGAQGDRLTRWDWVPMRPVQTVPWVPMDSDSLSPPVAAISLISNTASRVPAWINATAGVEQGHFTSEKQNNKSGFICFFRNITGATIGFDRV